MLSLPGGRPAYQLRPPMIPTFKRGGRVAMPEMAERMRRKGQGEDTVLAHIHPYEAAELARKYGYSGKNPETGLPQYGRWISKKITKQTKKWLPALGSLIGAAIGGPPGAALGGALGGAVSGRRDAQGHRKFISNALRGLGTGAMVGGGQWLGGQMGIPGISGPVSPSAQGGAPVVKGIPTWTSGLKSPAAAPSGGGFLSGIGSIFSGMGGNAGPGAAPQGGGLPGIFGGIGDAIGGLSKTLGLSPAQLALAGLTGYGMLKGKNKKPGPREGEEALPASMRRRPERERQRVSFGRPYYIEPPEDYRPDSDGQEHNYIGYGEPEGYAAGGYVHGRNPGALDDVHMTIPVGSFVVDASTLSDIGDGNSLAGDATLDRILQHAASMPQKRRARKYADGGMINARVSSGEKVIPKEYVDAVGKGSNQKGATKLQKMVNKVRKMKRGSERLPRRMSPKILSGLMGAK